MNAMVYERYGPPEVLRWAVVPDPTPTDHQVLIAVHATSATIGDARVRAMNVPAGFELPGRLALGITGPRQPILGVELAGVVAAAGKAVTRFRVGDAVRLRYDVIMDNAGTAPYARSAGSLAPGGRFLLVLGTLGGTLGATWRNLVGPHPVVAGLPRVTAEEVRELAALAEAGIYRPVIDRTFPLEQAAAAHAIVDTGHKRGNIALVVRPT